MFITVRRPAAQYLDQPGRNPCSSCSSRGANTEAMCEIVLRLYAASLQDVTEFMSTGKRSSGEPLATSKGEQGAC